MNIDPRSKSSEKLTPPAPLPYVSRRALSRVKGYMPPPTECPHCGGAVDLINHADLYGREYSDWPYMYICRPCTAYVGLHPNTDLPLGTLADKATREARKVGKGAFHDLMRSRGWARKTAYIWLASELEIPTDHCHWGWFDANQAANAGAICTEALEDTPA